jgi:hypothetical protein
MEIAMSAAISQKKGWVVTQESFERMQAELHPDIQRAGDKPPRATARARR